MDGTNNRGQIVLSNPVSPQMPQRKHRRVSLLNYTPALKVLPLLLTKDKRGNCRLRVDTNRKQELSIPASERIHITYALDTFS